MTTQVEEKQKRTEEPAIEFLKESLEEASRFVRFIEAEEEKKKARQRKKAERAYFNQD
jgi:hypothetical protein